MRVPTRPQRMVSRKRFWSSIRVPGSSARLASTFRGRPGSIRLSWTARPLMPWQDRQFSEKTSPPRSAFLMI